MKNIIVCSTSFYNKIKEIKKELNEKGHAVIMPNCYEGEDIDYEKIKLTICMNLREFDKKSLLW